MDRALELTIADLPLILRGPAGLPIVEEQPSYQEFLGPAAPAGDRDRVPVTLTLEPPPDVTAWPVVFDSGLAWKLRVRDAERVLEWPPPDGPDPWWCLARLSGWAEAVTVHCPAQQAREDHTGPHLANPVRFPLDQLLLMYRLAARGGLLVHAAVATLDGRAVVFAGHSGAGKSTLTELLVGAAGVEAFSDDRVVLRTGDDGWYAWGTPWPGDVGVARNRGAPLDAVCVLRQGPRHRLRRLSRRDALARLLPVTSIPWFEREVSEAALAVLDDLLVRVPVLELEFALDGGVVDLLRERPWSPS